MIKQLTRLMACLCLLFTTACDNDDDAKPVGVNPDTAEEQSVDRFSPDAGTLMVRDGSNGLPEANAPINYDQAPFITRGFGPSGNVVEYYNFDVQSITPAPIYIPMNGGSTIDGQLNIIDDIPGDDDYNDFWHVHIVEVPDNFVANTITSLDEIMDEGYAITPTTTIVNCPVVPEGSTASKRIGTSTNGLVRGWYRGKVVYYFVFEEKALTASGGLVPVSPIYVTFNINPGSSGGGPPSGFVTESGSDQTHNVVATVPESGGYSPLWSVNIYDNADFSTVSNLSTAQMANILATGAALVNCPIVTQ